MKVGYVDERERFFCLACWVSEVDAGRRPVKILDDEEDDLDDPDNFWIVDNCAGCERRIQYKGVKVLG